MWVTGGDGGVRRVRGGTALQRELLQITMRCRVRAGVHGEPSPCLSGSDRGEDSLLASRRMEDVQLQVKRTVLSNGGSPAVQIIYFEISTIET